MDFTDRPVSNLARLLWHSLISQLSDGGHRIGRLNGQVVDHAMTGHGSSHHFLSGLLHVVTGNITQQLHHAAMQHDSHPVQISVAAILKQPGQLLKCNAISIRLIRRFDFDVRGGSKAMRLNRHENSLSIHWPFGSRW